MCYVGCQSKRGISLRLRLELAVLLEEMASSAPPEVSQSIRRVCSSFRLDEEPSKEDVCVALLFLLDQERRKRRIVADAVRSSVESRAEHRPEQKRKEPSSTKKSAFADRIREEVSPESSSPVSARIRSKLGTRVGSDVFGRRLPKKEDK